MAAGPVTIKTVDFTPSALMGWQLLKAPITTAETAITAAKLGQNLSDVSFDEATVEVIPVEFFNMIEVMALANGTADQSPVLNLYGWSEWGPGHHIGTLTLDLSTASSAATDGFHAKNKTHVSIRNAFAAGTAWLIPDQYVVTADYEQERFADTTATPLHVQSHRALNVPGTSAIGGTIGTSTTEANFPQVFNVDFSHSQYKFFGVLPTSLDSATSVGAIFKPIRLKGGLTSPDGA
jgi:hypothetical protein